MSVTLSDVAKVAGVSIKTVSRVVNNQGEVSKETRERVMEAVEKLGYHPNILARGLVMQRTYTLAIVSWGLDQYPPSRFVMGVAREADEQGYSVLLTLLRSSTNDKPDLVINSLVSRQVDGIIWQAPRVGNNQSWIVPERLAKLPPVVINSLPNPNVTTVSIDNYHGGVVAMQHLVEQGWKTIGIITGWMEHPMSQERLRGWRDVLEGNHLECDPSLIVHGDWTVKGGDEAMEILLKRRPDIDAVFSSNDTMALGAMRAAQRNGRIICRDLGVIGYENHPESAYFSPPLSTIHQPVFELGREAVRLLVKLIEKNSHGERPVKPELVVYKPELVIRQSSLRCSSSNLNEGRKDD